MLTNPGVVEYVVRLVLSGEFQGTESLWLDSKLSVVVGPSRDGALGVIGLTTRPALQERRVSAVQD
jgi:hypothetical protein